ncbi:MAG: hypothetical protein JO152_08295 [Mycobacteriaceae bacterium]|nr:hypothetical protein [Mycobacteriaceae bacterium]
MSLSRVSMAFVGAVLAGLVILIVMSATSGPASSPPSAGAQPAAPAAPFPTDDRGFLNSPARCDAPQSAVAIGRTSRSLVVICAEAGKYVEAASYQYRGVRLGDGATLTLPAVLTGDGSFVAAGDAVTYVVSPKELTVKSGDTVLRQEAMITYQQPRFSAETGASGQTPR